MLEETACLILDLTWALGECRSAKAVEISLSAGLSRLASGVVFHVVLTPDAGDSPGLDFGNAGPASLTDQLTRIARRSPALTIVTSVTQEMRARFGPCEKVFVAPLVRDRDFFGCIAFGAGDLTGDLPALVELLAPKAALAVAHVLEREQLAERVRFLSDHDALITRLPNSAVFRRHLAEAIAAGSDLLPAVVLLDLDNLNRVNRASGYLAGDAVLREVARRWQKIVAEEGSGTLLARLGGDEFVVSIREVARSSEPAELAGKLLEALREPFVVNGGKYTLNASAGVSRFPQDGRTVEDLLWRAERALFRAKDGGGSLVCDVCELDRQQHGEGSHE